MKKILAVLIFSVVCVAILFAQEAADKSQTPEPVRAVPQVMPAPATLDQAMPAVEPVRAAVVQPVEEKVVEEEQETDVIGIADDLSAGADIRGGLISLSLKNVEMQDVVRLFSRLSNANIIVPDLADAENPKRIDVNLDNVEWKPALKAILDTHGLELIEKIPGSEVYSVRTRAADAPEPVEIQVFKLDYATVGEVLTMVNGMVNNAAGQISSYPARNTIVVKGTAQLLNDLNQIITAIDLPRDQVSIEAKFLELTDIASKQLGIDWGVLGGYRVGLDGIQGSYGYEKTQSDSRNNFSSRNSSYDQNSSYNQSRFVDIAGRPYEEIESAPSIEYATDPLTGVITIIDNGVDYGARPGNLFNFNRVFGITPTTESLQGNGSLLGTATGQIIDSLDESLVGKTLASTLSAGEFSVVLAALQQMDGIEIVSNPKIIVANEETAKIYIGTKEPNIKQETTQEQNTAPVTTYSLDPKMPYFEYGIRLDVTPTVNTSSNITAQINPSLKRFIRDKFAGDNTYPVTTEKTIETIFSLKSGQTAAIGGLTELNAKDVDKKIPVLGSLPVIGRFFSYINEVEEQAETIIFVTLKLANPDSMELETGLPEDSTLAMRYRAMAQAEIGIHQEELRILKEVEAERLQNRLESLRTAEQERLEAVRVADQELIDQKLAEEQKLLEQERVAEQKQLENQQKLLEKERAAEQKQLEKARSSERKQLENQQKLLEKERAAEQKQLEKQQKQLEKERAAEQKQLEKEKKQLEKQIAAEQKRLEQPLAEEESPQVVEQVSPQVVEEESPQVVEEVSPQVVEEVSPQVVEAVSQRLVKKLFEEAEPQQPIEEVSP